MAFPAEEWRLPAYQIMIGDLEPGLVRMMKETIKEGMSVVDVGANVGTYTLLALRAIGFHGRVYSYEPTPRIFSILTSNVQVNGFLETGRIDLRRKAVSDGTRTSSTFFLQRNSPTHNSLYASDGGPDVEAIEVETVSLDRDLGVDARVDVVKIDAEGAEPAILRGMRGIIENNPGILIFMEWAPQHLRRAGVDVGAYIGEVRGLGFDVYNVEEPTGHVEAVSNDTLRNCFSLNLMLRRPDR
jgi:FkbM family methyltransferase